MHIRAHMRNIILAERERESKREKNKYM